MSAKTPICWDCRHHYFTGLLQLDMCGRTFGDGACNPVTGDRDSMVTACHLERRPHGLWARLCLKATRCGPEGQHFEPFEERRPPTQGSSARR